jgi:hypothetical protein
MFFFSSSYDWDYRAGVRYSQVRLVLEKMASMPFTLGISERLPPE